MENVKNLELEGKWAEFGLKIACSHNSRQSIWNKMEKLSKTGLGKKSLVPVFPSFCAIAEV